jgi:putative Ca2+/H+ antiporter (TMEM165/GDT1 family)
MRRRTFDAVATVAGLVLAVVLAVGGGLLVWGHSVVSTDVHSQLAAQKIVFPTASSPEIKALPASDATAMRAYAGQLMTTGAQAQTYADHFIAVHLAEIGGGKTYSQLSAEAMAAPKNVALAAQVATIFKGTTLRGMLLNAYGWWQMGQIMLTSAIVAFAAAGLFLIFSLLGFWHLRRTTPEAEVFPKLATRVEVNA